MELKELNIKGVYEIILNPIGDHRGFFMRTYDETFFYKNGLVTKWVQENHSFSANKDTLRGLHFQFPPFAETKVVRCVQGEILDVFVDLRKSSPTFGQWGSVVLSSATNNIVYIPKGFAHGFCTLTDNCHVMYKVDNFYSKEHECGLLWNDPKIGIVWPVDSPVISEKDSRNFSLNRFFQEFKAIEV